MSGPALNRTRQYTVVAAQQQHATSPEAIASAVADQDTTAHSVQHHTMLFYLVDGTRETIRGEDTHISIRMVYALASNQLIKGRAIPNIYQNQEDTTSTQSTELPCKQNNGWRTGSGS